MPHHHVTRTVHSLYTPSIDRVDDFRLDSQLVEHRQHEAASVRSSQQVDDVHLQENKKNLHVCTCTVCNVTCTTGQHKKLLTLSKPSLLFAGNSDWMYGRLDSGSL